MDTNVFYRKKNKERRATYVSDKKEKKERKKKESEYIQRLNDLSKPMPKRYFLTNIIVLPLTYDKSCDVFESIEYDTPALYWVHVIAMCSALPMSSHGVLQFFKKCGTLDAPIVFRNEYNPAPPSSFGPPLIGSAVFLLFYGMR